MASASLFALDFRVLVGINLAALVDVLSSSATSGKPTEQVNAARARWCTWLGTGL